MRSENSNLVCVHYCCECSVKLRQWRVTSGTSEDKMRRDNSAPDMLKIGQ